MAITTIGAVTASSLGTTLTSGGANTKGSYVELEDSTAADCDGVIVVIGRTSDASDFMVDIATGAESSETDLIANLPIQSRSSVFTTSAYYIPVPISSGTRVSARCQSSTAGSDTCSVICYLVSFDTVHVDNDTTAIVTIGANTADTGGVEIDPGAMANTKGSYVEVKDSTAANTKFIIPMVAGKGNAARTGGSWLLDIATGAAMSESVIIANLYFDAHTATDAILPQVYPPIPIEVASGTRLSVRAQSDITDATDRLLDVILILVNGTAAPAGGGGQHFSASFMG
jgi:hypothetical protein